MSESNLEGVQGEVKWFDPRKGYGFIVGPEGQDIFVHFSVIEQEDGFRTLRDGEMVQYSADKGDKGWSATRACSTAGNKSSSVAETKPEPTAASSEA